ncbi:hypothetical protein MMC2321_04222 [Chitinophaga sp. MM2321]
MAGCSFRAMQFFTLLVYGHTRHAAMTGKRCSSQLIQHKEAEQVVMIFTQKCTCLKMSVKKKSLHVGRFFMIKISKQLNDAWHIAGGVKYWLVVYALLRYLIYYPEINKICYEASN